MKRQLKKLEKRIHSDIKKKTEATREKLLKTVTPMLELYDIHRDIDIGHGKLEKELLTPETIVALDNEALASLATTLVAKLRHDIGE